MNSLRNPSPEDRLLEMQMEELSGRVAPPDRVDAILRRAASERVPPAQSSPRRSAVVTLHNWWRPAALALLGVGVTFAVAMSARSGRSLGTDVGAESQVVAAAVVAPQDPKGTAREQLDQLKARLKELRTRSSAAGSRREKNQLLEEFDRLAVRQSELEARVQREEAARQDGIHRKSLELDQNAARHAMLKAKLQAMQASRAAGAAVGKDVARVQEEIVQLQVDKKLLEQDLRRLRQGGAARPRAAANPLVRGDYRKALAKLDTMREQLLACPDAKKSRMIIDEMSQLLERARAALWEVEKGGVGPAPKGGQRGDRPAEAGRRR